jgi:hypothetical protein
VSFVTHFRAGGVDEWTGISGTAHLFEHILFKGTHTIGTTNFAAEASHIVAQQLGYAVDGLPANWFDLYLRGSRRWPPRKCDRCRSATSTPDELVVVVVGKPSAFDKPLSELGAVTVMPVDSIRR